MRALRRRGPRARAALLGRHEVLHDGLREDIRREEALRQEEIVIALAVEAFAQRELRLRLELQRSTSCRAIGSERTTSSIRRRWRRAKTSRRIAAFALLRATHSGGAATAARAEGLAARMMGRTPAGRSLFTGGNLRLHRRGGQTVPAGVD
jgi:hypothetical protein